MAACVRWGSLQYYRSVYLSLHVLKSVVLVVVVYVECGDCTWPFITHLSFRSYRTADLVQCIKEEHIYMHECHVILKRCCCQQENPPFCSILCVFVASLEYELLLFPHMNIFLLQRSRLQVFSPLTSHLTCKQTDTPLSHMKFQNAPYTKIFESSFICGEEFTVALVRTYL